MHQRWLIDYFQFYVPLKNISLIWRRHHCRRRASKFRPMLGAQGLWAGRDLYCATPAVTRDLGFSGLIRRTAPFSRLLRHTRGCGGSILTRILTGMHQRWLPTKHEIETGNLVHLAVTVLHSAAPKMRKYNVLQKCRLFKWRLITCNRKTYKISCFNRGKCQSINTWNMKIHEIIINEKCTIQRHGLRILHNIFTYNNTHS
jgi:hypothetical protein